jgi:hypothetical protein
LGRLVEVVNVAILFQIHFTQMMGSLHCGALFMEPHDKNIIIIIITIIAIAIYVRKVSSLKL